MKALLDGGDILELFGMKHLGLRPGRAPFRADGTGKGELAVMKGSRTVSSGSKSIAHILHHFIGFVSQKPPGHVILLDGERAVESERDGKPSPLS